jgi:SAM-dependent methyltransferase
MEARAIRRTLKNSLNRLPTPLRDRLSRVLLRGYESYVAAKQSLRERRSADHGLPLPPPKLRVTVVGHADPNLFLNDGRRHNEIIREALSRAGSEVGTVDRLLDWGCGCGRIVRWWSDLPDAEIHGCDYNPKLVRWVDRNLPFVDARVNDLAPPLPYEDGAFDAVYAISIFTHLTDELAIAWMGEIRRILSPGGHFFFTTHGRSYRDRLSPAEAARFAREESVVQFARVQGSNLCAAYHPSGWVRAHLLDGFELVEVREAHTLSEVERAALNQDRWLVRKRP